MIKSVTTTLFAVYSISSAIITLPITLPNGGVPMNEFLCNVPYTAAAESCAGKEHTLVNPANKVKLECGAQGSCAQSMITLEYMSGGSAQEIEFLNCGATYSCYQTVWTFVNMQGGSPMKLNRVECSEPGSCQEMKIYLNNVDLGDVECYGQSVNCAGCEIFEAGYVDAE
eukprot:843694_1